MIDRQFPWSPGGALTRRAVVGMGAAITLAAPLAAARPGERVLRLIVGTYRGEGGGGLYPLSYDPAAERWSPGAPIAAIANASFGVYNPRHDLHYLLDEQDEGMVAAYRSGDWTRRGPAWSVGAGPCHITLDVRQRYLAIANYGDGSVAVLAIDPATGALAGPPIVRANSGAGPNAERQRGPHAHWVGFGADGRWLYSVDLGADAVRAYDLRDGIGAATIAYRAPPGSGPRHMMFHPHLRKAFLLSELESQVTLLDSVGDGRFRAAQTVPTVPPGFAGVNYPAELAINHAGDRLYVSNRGHDSIAVFAVAPDGHLTPMQHVATGGRWPRFFLLIEEAHRLLVANERSGALQAFAVLPDGLLRSTGDPVAVPGAAFIARLGPAR